MPLEGHWQRVNTPIRQLGRRERRIALAVAAGLAIAAIVLVLTTAGRSTTRIAPGCISAIVPFATGGEVVSACGARARRTCAEHATQTDPGSLSIERSCRRAGLR